MEDKAIVAKVTVRPHPNADRVQLADVLGYQVVVGPDVKTGDVGLLFAPDLQLGEDFARANGLLRAQGGYFGENRRVTVQRFRGAKSEAYWSPLTCLSFAGLATDGLQVGERVVDWGGVKLCQKWTTPQTLRARAGARAAGVKGSVNGEVPWFRRHTDTDHLRHATAADFPPGSRVFLTEKLHGTSHRVGMVPAEAPSGWVDRLAARFGLSRAHPRWRLVSGSRRVVLTAGTPDTFHGGTFREDVCQLWAGELRAGEVVYGEIVGFAAPGSPIMAPHSPADSTCKALRARTGPIVYAYGLADGQAEFHAYRIVQYTPDGHPLELSWEQMARRCQELGIHPVPLLDSWRVPDFPDASPGALDDAVAHAKAYVSDADGAPVSSLDDHTPMEGVCLRVERPDGRTDHWKLKTFGFCEMEGIQAERPGHVDTEEAS